MPTCVPFTLFVYNFREKPTWEYGYRTKFIYDYVAQCCSGYSGYPYCKRMYLFS